VDTHPGEGEKRGRRKRGRKEGKKAKRKKSRRPLFLIFLTETHREARLGTLTHK
jgi:hypothetical protein